MARVMQGERAAVRNQGMKWNSKSPLCARPYMRKGAAERRGVKNRRKAERASRARESAVNKTGIIRQSRSDFICASTLLRFYSAASYPL